MEGGDLKVSKLQARKVAQDVLMFVWFKQGIIEKKPTPELSFVPEITDELLSNLCTLVWIESGRNMYVWEDFFKNHIKRITTTPYLFARYFAYASYIVIENVPDAYKCFLDVLSLVTHFALHCWQNEVKKFINCCVDLFCAFFAKELCTKFENQGRWENFNDYLKNHETLIRFKKLKATNPSENEIFKEFELEHLMSNQKYVINEVVLRDICEFHVEYDKDVALEYVTESQVQWHKKALSFADSVGDNMKEVYNKSFEKVLKDFRKTDIQVEDLYRETTGEASGGVESTEDLCQEKTDGAESTGDPYSMQEVQEDALQNLSGKSNLKKNKNKSKEVEAIGLLETPGTNSLKSQYLRPAPLESGPRPTSKQLKRAKVLLKEMMVDIAKISELTKFVCEENAIHVPIQVVDTVNNP